MARWANRAATHSFLLVLLIELLQRKQPMRQLLRQVVRQRTKLPLILSLNGAIDGRRQQGE